MTLETLSDNFSKAIPPFLDISRAPELLSKNVRQDHEFGRLYKKVQSEIKLDRAALDRVYNNPMINHFYSKDDIDKFYSKWK
jgi:hypothetical protein